MIWFAGGGRNVGPVLSTGFTRCIFLTTFLAPHFVAVLILGQPDGEGRMYVYMYACKCFHTVQRERRSMDCI